mgnify:CR=1 FL=1
MLFARPVATLVQAARLLVTVGVLPFWLQFVGGQPLLADVVLDDQQLVGRVETLHPLGMVDGDRTHPIARAALAVAQR